MYIVSTFLSRALDLANASQNAKNFFVFGGGAFPMTVSESLSSSEFALLCTSESLSLFYNFCFVFIFRVCFCTTVRFVRSQQKKNIQLFTKFLMKNLCVIKKFIVNCTYVVNDNRLGCFVSEKQTRKIKVKFDKVTPVKPFIYRLFD